MRLFTLAIFALATTLVVACGGEEDPSSLDSSPRSDAGYTDTSTDGSVDSGRKDAATEVGSKDGADDVKDGDCSGKADCPSCPNPEASEGEDCDDPCHFERQVKCYAWTCEDPAAFENDKQFHAEVKKGMCKIEHPDLYGYEEKGHYKYDGGKIMKFDFGGGEWVTCTGTLVKSSGPVCSQAEAGR